MNRLQKQLFSYLLSWTKAKNLNNKGYILNSFATQLAIYFICDLTREELKLGHDVELRFETLSMLGEHFGEFSCGHSMPPNRVQEALMRLVEIGFIKEERQDADANERENYHYRGKFIWKWTLLINDFKPYEAPENNEEQC